MYIFYYYRFSSIIAIYENRLFSDFFSISRNTVQHKGNRKWDQAVGQLNLHKV
jgi:hypothetical protein